MLYPNHIVFTALGETNMIYEKPCWSVGKQREGLCAAPGSLVQRSFEELVYFCREDPGVKFWQLYNVPGSSALLSWHMSSGILPFLPANQN